VAKCPECGALLDIDEDEVEEGEILVCPECEVELEVVNKTPLEFDIIEPEEEGEEESGGSGEEDEEED